MFYCIIFNIVMFHLMILKMYMVVPTCRYRFDANISHKKSPPTDLADEIQYRNSTYLEMSLHSSDMV